MIGCQMLLVPNLLKDVDGAQRQAAGLVSAGPVDPELLTADPTY